MVVVALAGCSGTVFSIGQGPVGSVFRLVFFQFFEVVIVPLDPAIYHGFVFFFSSAREW